MANIINGTDTGSGGLITTGDSSDELQLQTAETARVTLTNTAVVVNEGGNDVDFRVEGDTDANLLFVDASADAVGIGTNAPTVSFSSSTVLHVNGTASEIRFTTPDTGITNADGFTVGMTGSEEAYVLNRENSNLYLGTNNTVRMTIDNSGNVGIGTGTPDGKLHVLTSDASVTPNADADELVVENNGASGITIASSASSVGSIRFADSGSDRAGMLYYSHISDFMRFDTAATERMRIDASGNLLVAKTATDFTVTGCEIRAGGEVILTRNGDMLTLNRITTDGALIVFYQAGTQEGNISVSGNTVSYNPFLGSHSGALTDWSRPDIKIGTVMDTINELLDYKLVVIDVQEDVPAKDAVLDEEGNEVEPAQEATTQTVQKRISYNGNGAVGSTATVEYKGQEYTGTIQHEREEPLSFNKHLKVKINDTAASKTVFGVFVGWNNDQNNDGGVYNDMLVGAVGNYVIRMAAGQTPEAGDLVEADGNGCAVVQDDDIIRTKTIAKVTSTIPQVTYDDGSFLVTCVLYCG